MKARPKVLVVDNDKNILAAFRLLLAGKWFRPILCNNAKDALSKVICSHVDCVVAEPHLKGAMESGLEFLTNLRHARPHLPIIVITYELDSDLEKRIETLGVNALFPKPVDLHSLERRISSLLCFRSNLHENALKTFKSTYEEIINQPLIHIILTL